MTTLEEIYNYLKTITCHVLFVYEEKSCGVDPLSHTEFNMWFGEKSDTFASIDDVFQAPFFDGKSLTEIFQDVELEW